MIQGLGSILNSNIPAQQTNQSGNAQQSQATSDGAPSSAFQLNSRQLSQQKEPKGLANNRSLQGPEDLSEGTIQFISNIEGVIAQFIDQMDQEIGLPSEKVLATLDQFDFSVLSQKPQTALENFIDLTGVEPESQEKAGQIFVNFLQDLKKASGQPEEQSKSLKVEVLSAQDYVRKQRNEGIDRLNSKFFSAGTGSFDISAMNMRGSDLSQIEIPKAFPQNIQTHPQFAQNAQAPGQNDPMQSLGEFFRDANDVSNGKASVQQNGLLSSELSTQMSESLVQKLNNLTNKSKAAAQSLAAYGKMAAQAGEGIQVTPPFGKLAQASTGANQQAVNINELMLAGSMNQGMAQEAAANGEQTLQGDAQSFENLVLGQGQAKTSQAGEVAKGFMVETPQLTPQQRQENFGEIVKQAQVMAKDGGGEMKMQLRPEGVGEINLKVNVKDGQVNVQMIASNKQAKALLEDGIADLKMNLSGNKLTLEDLKIDLAQDARKDYQQNPEEQARQEQREFAQGFMNQYRQEREVFHGGLSGIPKRPGSTPAEPSDDIKPIVNESSKESRRRLNLVA